MRCDDVKILSKRSLFVVSIHNVNNNSGSISNSNNNDDSNYTCFWSWIIVMLGSGGGRVDGVERIKSKRWEDEKPTQSNNMFTFSIYCYCLLTCRRRRHRRRLRTPIRNYWRYLLYIHGTYTSRMNVKHRK